MGLPTEILQLIKTFLSPFEAKEMANSLMFVDETISNRIWRYIFSNDEWLKKAISYGAEPVLIGCCLDSIGSQKCDRKQIYLVLHANDFSGHIFDDGIDCLRKSLRKKHRYNSTTHEVTLPESRWRNGENQQRLIPKIVLNVRDIVRGSETLTISKKKTRKLFERRDLKTMYSFYTEPEIKTLCSSDIAGIGGLISEVGGLSPICAITLRSPQKNWQVILNEPDCPDVMPIFRNEAQRNPHEIIAYRFK